LPRLKPTTFIRTIRPAKDSDAPRTRAGGALRVMRNRDIAGSRSGGTRGKGNHWRLPPELAHGEWMNPGETERFRWSRRAATRKTTMGPMRRLITVVVLAQVSWAAEVQPVAEGSAEMQERHAWVAAKLDGEKRAAPPSGGWLYWPILTSCAGTPGWESRWRSARRSNTRGVFCHAASKVAVRLPAPGKAFSAFVGWTATPRRAEGVAASCSG